MRADTPPKNTSSHTLTHMHTRAHAVTHRQELRWGFRSPTPRCVGFRPKGTCPHNTQGDTWPPERVASRSSHSQSQHSPRPGILPRVSIPIGAKEPQSAPYAVSCERSVVKRASDRKGKRVQELGPHPQTPQRLSVPPAPQLYVTSCNANTTSRKGDYILTPWQNGVARQNCYKNDSSPHLNQRAFFPV